MAVTIATGVVLIRPEMEDSNLTTRMRQSGRESADAFARGMGSRLRAHVRTLGGDLDHLGERFTDNGRRSNIFTRALGSLGGAFGSMGRSITGAFGSLGTFGKIAAAIIPSVAGIVQGLQALAPAAYGAATGFTALVSVFGAIKIGTSGIGDAMKQAFEPGTAQQKFAIKTAQQHERALRAVQDATESAARANAQAAKQVKAAEDDLKTAQKAALAVQKELTQAREDAKMELEDLNSALANSELDYKDAVLGVRQAEEHLREVTAKGNKATQLERDEAALQLEEARQRLADQTVETDRLKKKTDAANKAGIDGTQVMTSWRDKLNQANQEVADREQKLADEREQAAQTAVDGQKAIADAVQSLNEKQEAAIPPVNKFADAMSKLSPVAQGFVRQLIAMKPAWDSLKWQVQDSLLRGFATQLQSTGEVFLPALRKSLSDTATVLNGMGLHVMQTASTMAKDGTFGKAMDAANSGLRNLTKLPGDFLKGLMQMSIGGAPAFNSLTKSLSQGMANWNERLSKGLQTGELQKRVELAVQVIKDIGASLKNMGTIFTNVFGQFQKAGGGFFTTLKEVTASLAVFTADKTFQAAIKALAETFALLARTALPVVGQILGALAPVLMALAPPVQQLIKDLGSALTPIIAALGPVLVVAAKAVGSIVQAFSPLLPIIGSLIAQLLPPLMPVIQAISQVFQDLAPIVAMVANILVSLLAPIIAGLTPIIKPLTDALMQMSKAILPVILDLLIALAPTFALLGQVVGQLMTAFGPLLGVLATLIGDLLTALAPILTPIIQLVGQLALILSQVLASGITNVVIPVIKLITDLLRGDFSGAWQDIKDLLSGAVQWFVDAWDAITGTVQSAVDAVIGIFEYLYDVIIGHSIVPDLVRGIIQWFVDLGTSANRLFGQMRDWVVQKLTDLKNRAIGSVISMATSVATWFTSMRDRGSNAIGELRDWASAKARQLRDWILNPIQTMKEKAIGAFVSAVASIKTAWDKLNKIAKDPVSFMINTVYNNGIRKVWNAVVGAFGGKQLGEIKGFARGGVLPGSSSWRGGDTHLVPMREGEGVYVSEAMRDPYERARLHAVNKAAIHGQSLAPFQTSHTPGFAKGGIFDGIGSALSGAWDRTKKGFGWLADTFGGAVKSGVNAVVNPLINTMPKAPPWAALMRTGAMSLKDSLLGGGKKGDEQAIPNVNYKPSAGVEQWRPVVLQALREVGQSASLANTTLRRMNQESGGNPTIVNKWDSNWKAGHPSVGLMQVIGPTFQAYAGKYRKTGPFLYGTSTNPLANVYSSMQYALGAYGSLSRAYDRPGGYAKGGVFNPPWVSRDMGGLLPDGVAAINTSGTAEVVSTLDQLKALVASGRGQTYIFNEGAIQLDASKVKSIQDVVEMIDALKVTSRQFGGRV